MFYSILIPQNLANTYQYSFNQQLNKGQLVVINFNNKLTIGVIISKDEEKLFSKLKEISCPLNYELSPIQIQFLNFIAKYNLQTLGNVLKMFINKNITKSSTTKKLTQLIQSNNEKAHQLKLSEEQQIIFEKSNVSEFKVFLIEGITGSGKTEIYIKLLLEKILNGYQCLLLLPEIALTDQIYLRCKKYGLNPFVYTSFTTEAQKREIWKEVHNKNINFIIGTRSALFLPFKNLGIIIIDEEHDNSYKQEESPSYHARDMAIFYSKINNTPIILGTATPSIESFYNTIYGNYEHLKINSRYSGNKLPSINFINKQNNETLTEFTLNKIKTTLQKNEQVLIYFNKRGYNLMSKCTNCLKILECPHCSSYLVKHPFKGVYECHYCFYKLKIENKCNYCNSSSTIESFIDGIEKVAEKISEKFPNYKIGIASSDTFTTLNKINEFLTNIREKKFNIIIGTQIIAKGHHFNDITLACILDLDSIIKSQDIRSLEKAYQFINQISGRAGRGEKEGEVLIQSSLEKFDNDLLFNREKFFDSEMLNRKKFNLPPFKRLTSIIVSNSKPKNAEDLAKQISSELSKEKYIEVMGPIPSPIYKLANKYRWRILLKYDRDFAIQNILLSKTILKNKSVKIDIDPLSFF